MSSEQNERDAARKATIKRYLNHELLIGEVFDAGYQAGQASRSQWVRIDGADDLPKGEGCYLVKLFDGKYAVSDYVADFGMPPMFYGLPPKYVHQHVTAYMRITEEK